MIPTSGTRHAHLGDLIGTEDLRQGICHHATPTIWSGPWFDRNPTAGSTSKQTDYSTAMKRAVSICSHCPVLASCERQLTAFEKDGKPVHGIMAGRRYGEHPVGECRNCGRPMHRTTNRKGTQQSHLPDGHAYFASRGLCRSCYKTDWKNRHAQSTTDPEVTDHD
ncbi:MAG: hypothetical protein LKG15_07745 [Corynebacterium provencense]|uniref:hypothetical protein n=1 Tax=Corynebacterium provencense TaxID=1737425 RepID=UPI002989CF16|nr:hypothetical protein [Corynebacterium provencense]